MVSRTTLLLGALALGASAVYTKNVLLPEIQINAERARYEQDMFNKAIIYADSNKNEVLELSEASEMLRFMGYSPKTFYEGKRLLVYHTTFQNTQVSDYSDHVSITFNVSDLEKYVQIETPGVHREGIPGVFMEKSM